MRNKKERFMKTGKKMFDLTDKVAVITGGGSGLGRVFSLALAEFGASIAVADLDLKGAEETAALVAGIGAESLPVQADVNNPADVDKMISDTLDKMKHIDILVNNAGINARPAKIGDIPIEDWDRVLGVDLRAVFICTRAVLPVMVKQKNGNIINISSILGVKSIYDASKVMPLVHYSVAKAGVISLTRETAVEYAQDGIRANCIAPGWHVGTKLSSEWKQNVWQKEERLEYEKMIKRITPMGRRGEVEELKGLVVFLSSDDSSFMTGQVLVSDGGVCT